MNGAPLPDDVLSMLMNRGGEKLLPSPEHAIFLQPGEQVELDAGLLFHRSPGEVGIERGDIITFTALFVASEGPMVEPPRPSPVVDPIALAEKYGEKPRYGGTFLSAVPSNPPHRDIHQFTGNIMTMAPLYNGLLMANPYDWQDVLPDLVWRWEVKPDGRAWIFFLSEGIRWHDGEPFTSQDVVYSFNRILSNGRVAGNEETGSFRDRMWEATFEKFEAIDDLTVAVITQGPTPLVPKILSDAYASIIPAHISEKDPLNALREDPAPMGTGPFRLAAEPDGNVWRYERNPDYFKPQTPFLDGIETFVIGDEGTRVAALLTQQIYWSSPTISPTLPLELAEDITRGNPHIIHEGIPTFRFDYLAMNAERAPFDDLRVRQAFNHALDRNAFLETRNQRGLVGTALFPEGEWAMPIEMRNELIGYGPDMEERNANATAFLAEYEAENGKVDWSNVQYTCAATADVDISCVNAEIVQVLMRKVGVDLVLKPLEIGEALFNQVDGEFDMAGTSLGIDFDDPADAFDKTYVSGARWGFHRHFDPEIDKLYEDMKFTADPEKRREIAWLIDQLAMNNSGMLVLRWRASEHLRWDFVGGWSGSPAFTSTNARMEHVFLNFDDLSHTREPGTASPQWSPTDWLGPARGQGAAIEQLMPWLRE